MRPISQTPTDNNARDLALQQLNDSGVYTPTPTEQTYVPLLLALRISIATSLPAPATRLLDHPAAPGQHLRLLLPGPICSDRRRRSS